MRQAGLQHANLALSEGDQLAPGIQFDGICEYTHSEYTLDALNSVDSGITGWLHCEFGELEPWISDYSASRHARSSHDVVTNYREYSGNVRPAGGEIFPIEGVGDILFRIQTDSEAKSSC